MESDDDEDDRDGAGERILGVDADVLGGLGAGDGEAGLRDAKVSEYSASRDDFMRCDKVSDVTFRSKRAHTSRRSDGSSLSY